MNFLRDPFRLEEEIRSPRLVLWFTALALVIAIFWARSAELEQIVRGNGKVVPSSRVQEIQTEDGGVIVELRVAEGDVVEKGDLLVAFDAVYAEADVREAEARVQSAQAKLARLKAEILGSQVLKEGDSIFTATQYALYEKRQRALNEEIEGTQSILDLIEEEIAINQPLIAEGDVSQTEILRLKRQAAELEAKIIVIRNRFFEETQAEYAQIEEELERLEQLLIQKRRAAAQTMVYAPMRGMITNSQFSTLGAVARPGERLLDLVPIEADLIVEIKVSTSDVGFLRTGQPAVIKVDAFDYTIYGDLNGELIYISADAIEEETPQGLASFYKVRLRSNGERFSKTSEPLPIIPGMSVTGEIVTGASTVFDYVLKPVVKTLSNSLKEP